MEQWLEYEHWLHEAEAEHQFRACNLDDAMGWCGWWQWWALHPDSAAQDGCSSAMGSMRNVQVIRCV